MEIHSKTNHINSLQILSGVLQIKISIWNTPNNCIILKKSTKSGVNQILIIMPKQEEIGLLKIINFVQENKVYVENVKFTSSKV